MHSRIWATALVAGGTLLSACAGGPPPPPPTPENLSALEAAQQQHPQDAGIMTRLGIAYYEARDYGRARDVLRSALTLNKQNYAAHVYLGLAWEGLEQFDSARVAYTTAATQARDDRQRDEIGDRLELLTRSELRVAARRAIAQESLLSTQPAEENAVAVFPFRYTGANADLQPLSRGLTHLMITDLSKLSRLTLLERERVQALVDEMALTETGRTDPSTGARSGRMLRAGRVVQGAVSDVPGSTEIRLDASVVNAINASVVASGTGNEQLQQLFALQKQVMFRLVEQMGITLSPAERRALSERPTADLQAFLAFSRGLEAEDRGDYEAANANFSAAVARDPNFRAARDRQSATQRVTQALQLSPQVFAGIDQRGADIGPSGPAEPGAAPTAGRGPILRTGVLNTVPSVGSTLTTRVGSGPVSRQPTSRPQLPETLGGDGIEPGLTGTIIIIITRP